MKLLVMQFLQSPVTSSFQC